MFDTFDFSDNGQIFIIYDSDFIAEDSVKSSEWRFILKTIIKVYSSRNIFVAPNIMRFFKYVEKQYDWGIKYQVKYHIDKTPEYRQYHSEIEKYLSLL